MLLGYIDSGSGFTIFALGGWFIAFLIGLLTFLSLFFKRSFKFFKHNKKVFLFLIAIFLCITMIGIKLMGKKEVKFNKKIVIIGIDGLSPTIIEPMMKENELPNFSSLKEQGSYRRLSTTNPSQSPVAWAGFATGQNPGKNGIFDFITRDPKTYDLSLSFSNIEKGRPKRVVKSKCFWNYTTEQKIPTVIISCPVSFPPDKVYVYIVSQEL